MKLISYCFILILSTSLYAGWENPALLCPEEILPRGLNCLDLSSVKNPYTDFPSVMSAQEKDEWQSDLAADLKLCRNQEVLRRESLRPGSFTPLQVQLAWMIVDGGKDSQKKLESILAASQKHLIPPHILIGALTQESLMASLGISPDGGNYSCGIAQLNIQEWCTSINWLPYSEREKLGWPSISCEKLPSTIVKPFYDIAVKKLGNRPAYKITATDFEDISFDQVEASLPTGTDYDQEQKFKAVTSFLKNCQDVKYAIPFKAQTLKNLFMKFVPAAMRNQNLYKQGETFPRRCESAYSSQYYPLHTGWLLAVAQYNAGPRQTQLVEHYYQVKNNVFPQISPTDLIEALHWGGKVKETNNRVYFVGQNGFLLNQPWYKSCVVQRHVARVIQHVTQPGKTIARSLEQVPCSQGTVPKYRRFSSGIKE